MATLPVRRRLAAAAVGCLAAPLLVAGCGSDDASSGGAIDTTWFGATAPADVLAAATEAMAAPTSLRLQQQARSGDDVLTKRLLVSDEGDCTGRLQLPSWGQPADLVVLDGDGAFRGDRGFWLSIDLDLGDDPDAADALRTDLADSYGDRWATTADLDTLCALTDFLRPVTEAAGDDDLVKDGLGDVDGEPAGRVVGEVDGATVTTFVALSEPHRVLRVAVGHGDGSDGPVAEQGDSVTTFSDFGTTVTVDFPDDGDLVTFEPPEVADP